MSWVGPSGLLAASAPRKPKNSSTAKVFGASPACAADGLIRRVWLNLAGCCIICACATKTNKHESHVNVDAVPGEWTRRRVGSDFDEDDDGGGAGGTGGTT